MHHVTRRDAIRGGTALAASLALPGAAAARDIDITLVSASPVSFVWNKVIADVFVPNVTEAAKALGDNITWKELYGTMVKRGGEIQAVRDGAAQMAFPTMTAYTSELPLQSISYVIPYGTEDMKATSSAMHELNLTDPGFADSYRRYENTYICNYATPSYQLWTTSPVNSIEDIKGMKLGCSGLTTGWIKGTGAVPVEQHVPGFYNDVKNGVIDGALTWLWVGEAIKLAEVAPYVTVVNFGAVCPSIISINSKLWATFSSELKAAFMKAGEAYMAEVIARQEKLETEAVDKIKAMGGKIREVSFDERVQWAAALDEVPGEWAEAVEKSSGLPAKAALRRYVELLAAKGVKPVRQWKI